MSERVLQLKDQGNAAFKLKKYSEAEGLYRAAISAATADDSEAECHILFSNLAAVYFELGRLEECVEAADHALALDCSWVKAYYRKALALESLSSADPRAVLMVWEDAEKHCKSTPFIKKQLLVAKLNWREQFKTISVSSTHDLLKRYALLTDSREKLSTMAHFWNASSKSERFQHFNCFLDIISGAGEISQLPVEEMMMEMPMHNYHDLPRESIEPWCAYFEACTPDEKTKAFREIWAMLNSKEQGAVIADLQLFMGMQMQQQQT